MKGSTQEEEEDIEFTTKAGSFKEVIMNQLSKVVTALNCELRGGYYTTAPTKSGEEKEFYVMDSRETFCNGCLGLAILLEPRYDNDMKKAYTQFNEELMEIKADFIKKTSIDEEVILGEGFYTNENDKILLETYRTKKLNLFLALFSDLSNLLSRKNYLEIGGAGF